MLSLLNLWKFELTKSPHSGRPVKFDVDHTSALIKEETRQTSREFFQKMTCSHVTLARHLPFKLTLMIFFESEPSDFIVDSLNSKWLFGSMSETVKRKLNV